MHVQDVTAIPRRLGVFILEFKRLLFNAQNYVILTKLVNLYFYEFVEFGLTDTSLVMRHESSILVSETDRCRLKALVSDCAAPIRHIRRAEVILLIADGMSVRDITRRMRKAKSFVLRWQARFIELGFQGLLRNQRRPSQRPSAGMDNSQRGKALELVSAMAAASCWNGPIGRSMVSAVVPIADDAVGRSDAFDLMRECSPQTAGYYGRISSPPIAKLTVAEENALAAHVALGMCKFRSDN